LTVRDAKAGIASVEPALDEEVIDGRTYWFAGPRAPAPSGSTSAHLLPNYDEYWVAYKDRGPVGGASGRDAFAQSLVLDGRFAGRWRRTLKKDSVLVEASPHRRLSRAETRALASAVNRYGRFMERPTQLIVKSAFPNI